MAAPKRASTSLSDNQAYPQACLEASHDFRRFNNFRRNPTYNEILEHVTREQGAHYLAAISGDPDLVRALDEFRANDAYGNPRTYDYPGAGRFSPTTLRYVKVLADLKRHFRTLDGLRVCEIGAGYGGQCRIINAYFRPSAYCLVDIQPALELARRYLDHFAVHSILTYRTMNELDAGEQDLAISNYAFTELPRTLQDIYLDRVILRSKRGYLTYNEITPPEFHSYRAGELLDRIPGARSLPEEPLTHSGNCIIVWGIDAA